MLSENAKKICIDLVKGNLGIRTNARVEYITALIDSVTRELDDMQGLALDENNLTHLSFIADYATYRYSMHGEESGMPRHLQWRLHNLLIKKAGSDAGNI